VLLKACEAVKAKYPDVIGNVTGVGLVAGIQTVKRGTKQPDHDLAHRVIELCYQKGLLFFAPVGAWGQTVKICPPLTIPLEALEEGIAVMNEAFAEAIAELK
jgi:4-aminobutyrate aminotransferase-like enzyme